MHLGIYPTDRAEILKVCGKSDLILKCTKRADILLCGYICKKLLKVQNTSEGFRFFMIAKYFCNPLKIL